MYGFPVLFVSSLGRPLPDELIHHFNLIDPDHRELFLPISRRLLAAGHETGTVRLPWLLFGVPPAAGGTRRRERDGRDPHRDGVPPGAGPIGDELHAGREAVAPVPRVSLANG